VGDDRPDAVEAQYRAEMAWLHERRTPAATAIHRKKEER
jgi:hypothetical protein